MTDSDLIKAAYAETIKNIYSVLFDSFAGAAGDNVAESHAEQAFQRRRTRGSHFYFVRSKYSRQGDQ